jgi:pimeloyl-ACP methyl ester carboxylesterase
MLRWFLALVVPMTAVLSPHAWAASVTGQVPSVDGVQIAYSSTGSGEPALVFIHGGYADQSFWKEQLGPLAERFQVVTLDLAGHGISGKDRSEWSIDAFGEDVRAVVGALDLDSVVLIGNSLGGPVALSAAKKLDGRVCGVIAVDTFQDVNREWPPEARAAYLRALRENFPATCEAMVRQLLLEGTDADLYAWVEKKMCGFDPSIAPNVVEGVVDYDLAAEFASTEVPIRAILGETVQLDLEGNRELRSDFEAVVMKGCGHYPMLERPEEFNRYLFAYVGELGCR